MQLFSRKVNVRRGHRLLPVTFRDLGGGWNAVDEDLNLSMRFMPTLKNFHRTTGGAQELRYGTRFKTDIAGTVTGNILDQEYYNGRIIAVTDRGEICAVDDAGNKTAIWNSTIASSLVGNPSGWSTGLTSVDFVPFRNELVIHNGIDKPISIDSTYAVEYLADPSSGSNVNVPIGKFGCVAANYHCVAGIPAAPTTVYIASKGTAGVFPGDPLPNDSISLDVGAYAPEGADEIIGIGGFRSQLLVFFPGQTLVITLGVYDADGAHTPQIQDSMPNFGLLSHRCALSVHNDLIFADTNGVNSAKRNLFNNLLDSTPLSELISPEYKGTMGELGQTEAQFNTFVIRDKLRGEVLVFAPDRVFVYSFSEKLKYSSWSEFTGWTFTSGCTSFLGRVYLAEGTRIYQLGNKAFNEQYFADKIYDRDGNWAINTSYNTGALIYDPSNDTVYECLIAHISGGGSFASDRTSAGGYWEEYVGRDIEFDLELPWLDGKEPMREKKINYVTVLTKGTAHFDLELYTDNLYKDVDGNVIHDPAISLTMVGNDYRGAGFNVNTGSARKSNSPKLYKYPAKFKSCKFRIVGGATEPLTVVGISFLHARGKYKRG